MTEDENCSNEDNIEVETETPDILNDPDADSWYGEDYTEVGNVTLDALNDPDADSWCGEDYIEVGNVTLDELNAPNIVYEDSSIENVERIKMKTNQHMSIGERVMREPYINEKMITINQYLDYVVNDFEAYLATSPCLCNLHNLNFSKRNIPDYNDINLQQLYILRYTYGYAFEYKRMYYKLLASKLPADNINITSLGCGNMVDYWSLIKMLENLNKESCNVTYNGLDSIDWNYKFPLRSTDNVTFKKCNAIDEIANFNNLNSDVYIFPTSISEFTNNDIDRLCDCFQNKPIQQNTLYVLTSVRTNSYNRSVDMSKSEKLMKSITLNGFKTTDSPTIYWTFPGEGEKIASKDYDFLHPKSVMDCLKKPQLNTRCKTYKLNSKNCNESCTKALGWNPILNIGHSEFQIFTFERNN